MELSLFLEKTVETPLCNVIRMVSESEFAQRIDGQTFCNVSPALAEEWKRLR